MSKTVPNDMPTTGHDHPNPQDAGNRDVPGVIARPPLILLGFLLAGIAVSLVAPFPVADWWPIRIVGGVLIAAALAVFIAACRGMIRAGTNIPTNQPSLALVTGGMHSISRNPIYLSMGLLLLGAALAMNSVWMLLAVPLWGALMEWGVIRREERYLSRRFGRDYETYRARVRRWL